MVLAPYYYDLSPDFFMNICAFSFHVFSGHPQVLLRPLPPWSFSVFSVFLVCNVSVCFLCPACSHPPPAYLKYIFYLNLYTDNKKVEKSKYQYKRGGWGPTFSLENPDYLRYEWKKINCLTTVKMQSKGRHSEESYPTDYNVWGSTPPKSWECGKAYKLDSQYWQYLFAWQVFMGFYTNDYSVRRFVDSSLGYTIIGDPLWCQSN